METILVPTDFSESANNAVNYAVCLADFFDAKLVLVNATPVLLPSYDSTLPVETMIDMQKKAEENLQNLKNELLAKPHRKLTIECYTAAGYVFDVIESAEKKYNADLIVMGIVGEAGKIKEHVIGSTSVKVARNARLPVFIIPEKVTYRRIRKISFACDMDQTEESTLLYVVKYFNKLFDAELEVVHVEGPYEETSYQKARSSVFVEKRLENIQHKTVYVTHTDVGIGLQDYFDANPTDVVMLNPKKHNIFHTLFNESVTKKLAFHLHQPILTIR
ncbi:MAG TPA: universal stress protein [Bacteroidia bacterium]|jgi:nucleotide-binding universal stress UspA family protein|nr:universal stress protein [Bacteroidia bacterium]